MNKLHHRLRLLIGEERARIYVNERAADDLAFIYPALLGIAGSCDRVDAEKRLDLPPVQRSGGANHPGKNPLCCVSQVCLGLLNSKNAPGDSLISLVRQFCVLAVALSVVGTVYVRFVEAAWKFLTQFSLEAIFITLVEKIV